MDCGGPEWRIGGSSGIIVQAVNAPKAARTPRWVRQIPEGLRTEVKGRKGLLCVYCGGEGEALDHVHPWSHRPEHDFENLVPSCGRCNSIAGNRVFASFPEKQAFIRQRRQELGLPLEQPDESDLKIPVLYGNQKDPPIAARLESESGKVQRTLLRLHRRGVSWKQIGVLYAIDQATAWRVAAGRLPHSKQALLALGLPPRIDADTQHLEVSSCVNRECRKPFISNHPQRRRCFECSPPRRRRR